jgi:hypothetical protein
VRGATTGFQKAWKPAREVLPSNRGKYARSVDRELYTRTISSVVDYYEGYETLALILNVNVDELRRWADGRSRPPTEIFLRIVDLARRPPGTLRLVN